MTSLPHGYYPYIRYDMEQPQDPSSSFESIGPNHSEPPQDVGSKSPDVHTLSGLAGSDADADGYEMIKTPDLSCNGSERSMSADRSSDGPGLAGATQQPLPAAPEPANRVMVDFLNNLFFTRTLKTASEADDLSDDGSIQAKSDDSRGSLLSFKDSTYEDLFDSESTDDDAVATKPAQRPLPRAPEPAPGTGLTSTTKPSQETKRDAQQRIEAEWLKEHRDAPSATHAEIYDFLVDWHHWQTGREADRGDQKTFDKLAKVLVVLNTRPETSVAADLAWTILDENPASFLPPA